MSIIQGVTGDFVIKDVRVDEEGRLVLSNPGGGGEGTGGTATEDTLADVLALLDARLPSLLEGGAIQVSVNEPLGVTVTNVTPLLVDIGGSSVTVEGGATEVTLALLNDRGQEAMAGSLPVVIASDQSAVEIKSAAIGIGTSTEATDGQSDAAVIPLLKRIANKLVTAFGGEDDTAATDDTGSFTFMSFIKRLMNVKLYLGLRGYLNSISVNTYRFRDSGLVYGSHETLVINQASLIVGGGDAVPDTSAGLYAGQLVHITVALLSLSSNWPSNYGISINGGAAILLRPADFYEFPYPMVSQNFRNLEISIIDLNSGTLVSSGVITTETARVQIEYQPLQAA